MTETATLRDRLADIVGGAQVLTAPDDIATYRVDGRGDGGGMPLAVVRPEDADQVSAVARLAASVGVTLVVQGGRTGLTGGGLASDEAPGLIVSLDRLNRTVEIDPLNRTAIVDAGVRLSTLNAAAAAHDLFFPIDLGADPSIGGMIATNTGGARLLRYGDVRANLLSVDMVCADAGGTKMTLGAPLRKNNTGLDLKQLLVGASGATGIVTRATVSLQPCPAVHLTALLALKNPHVALPLLLALERAFGSWLTAFEGISAAALSAAIAHAPASAAPFDPTPPYAVLVELSGGAAFDEAMLEDLLASELAPFLEAGEDGVQDVVIDRRNRLWAIRHAVPDGLRAKGAVVACDIALLRGDVMVFRDRVAERLALETPALLPHDFGHIGDGGLHYNLVWPHENGPPDPAMIDAARSIVFDTAVHAFGGSFSAEHGIGPRNLAHYPRYVPADVRRLAGAIQEVMAPVPVGRVDFGMTGS